MKIVVHNGMFLPEGLLDLGHQVFPVIFRAEEDINIQIERVCPDPDLVLMELFGHIVIPWNLPECRYTTIAYCIDSSINEFYLSYLLHLFDYAFVDQKSSVKSLEAQGIQAVWLPLCISKYLFRTPESKEYGVSFAGRTEETRRKRNGLLQFLEQHHPINYIEGRGIADTQDLLAKSRVVLNENLFSGLTLRVLQGMASGALVLTESNADGVSDFFQDGEHLVCYDPYTILEVLADIHNNTDKYEKIARKGQQTCQAEHTSKVRAREILDYINAGNGHKKQSIRQQKYFLAQALYHVSLRFGGEYSHSVQVFMELSQGDDMMAGRAAFALGDIKARLGQLDSALFLYLSAVKKGLMVYPFVKLSLLFLQKQDVAGAVGMLESAVKQISGLSLGLRADLEKLHGESTDAVDVLICICKVYLHLGKVLQVGFSKDYNELFPDTAFETALLAWNKQPSVELLDLLLVCSNKYQLSGELLPLISQAAKAGFLTQEHCRGAYALAIAYYDFNLQQIFREYMLPET